MTTIKCTNKNCNNHTNGWQYKGKAQFYATCPNCYTKIRIKKSSAAVSTNNQNEVLEI